jgi:hypothetical protein
MAEITSGSIATGGCTTAGVSNLISDYTVNCDWRSIQNPYYLRGWDYGYIATPNKKQIPMSLSTMFKKLLDKDTQTLVKAGFLSETLELTDCGKSELITIMFDVHRKALIEAAQAKLDEAEKNKKK